jgi:hypothetical protein
MARRVRPTFLEVLEALECEFFHDLDDILREDKARRIYPRLCKVERFHAWEHTAHIVPDFFGSNKERKVATRKLYEKRERLRWFLRALYNFWMFDIQIPTMTKWTGLRYSRHRKLFVKILRQHKKNARQHKHVTRKARKQQQVAEATKALDTLKASKHFERLRQSSDTEEA